MIRFNSLYWSQTSPVVVCLQNNEINIRITSLYGSQPSSVLFAFKTAWLALELLVSKGPRPHLSFCACKTTRIESELLVSIVPTPHLWFFAFKAATLAPELQVSMGPSHHLWFLHAKQDFLIWIINLYGFQTSPMDLWMQSSVISIRNTSLHGSNTSSEVFQAKQRLLEQNYKSLWVPDLTCRFVHAKQRD